MAKNDTSRQSADDGIELKRRGHLFDFETAPFSQTLTKPKVSDEALNQRYATGEVRIVTEQARYPLAGILGMLKEEVTGEDGKDKELRYKLDPEYQRRHRWSIERKSRLIESFLMNVPVPPVFLYERDLARFEVMDGRQRLTALSDFYDNKFALTGLEYWSDLDGRTYATLPSKVRDGIDRRYISSIILLKETAADEKRAAALKKIVFERLNSGGVKLGNQETRNAVYNGPLNKLCIALSEDERFRRMWRIPLEPKPEEREGDDDGDESEDGATVTGRRMFEKMEDVELVLRFFAYRKIDEFKAGLNKISEFLDQFIVAGNQYPPEGLAQYASMFKETVTFLWDVLEADAFTILEAAKRRPTKIVYDPLMFVASSPEVGRHRDKLVAQPKVLREELRSMYSEEGDLFSGRRTNFSDTQDRNRCVARAFANAIARVSSN